MPEVSKTPEQEFVTGTVTEALPNTMFRVKVGDEEEVIVYLGGKMKFNRIKVLVGDSVSFLKDPYGGRGRIVKRL